MTTRTSFAAPSNIATRDARRPGISTGFYFCGYGPLPSWAKVDEPREHSRIKIERITEQEDLKRRGLM